MKVGDLPWVRIPAGPSVARPEATGATQGGNEFVEVLCVKVTFGDLTAQPGRSGA